jgi:hypothetical protein
MKVHVEGMAVRGMTGTAWRHHTPERITVVQTDDG